MASNKPKHKRGDIWLVDFDPTRPDEVGKVRPALIIQDDDVNEYYNSTVALPFSTVVMPDNEPLRVHYSGLSFLDHPSDLAITQIRSLSLKRFHKKLGSMPLSEMPKISQYIGLVLGLKQ